MCKGGPCKGSLKLIAKLKAGKGKAKRLKIGGASFDIPAGRSTTIAIKLSGPAKRRLGLGKTVTATVRGAGVVTSTVKIRPTAM